MEAKWKETWDYLGWKDRGNVDSTFQNDWNQTILTKINFLSNRIHKASLRGGGNTIYTHPKSFILLESSEYFTKDERGYYLGGRYNIIIDESLPNDKIYVKFIDVQLLDLQKKNPNLIFAVKKTMSSNDKGELSILILDKTSPQYEEAWKDSEMVLFTDEVLTGELTILNHEMYDSLTGEILVDYNNEISEDIWIPKNKKVADTLNLNPSTTNEERHEFLVKKAKQFQDHPLMASMMIKSNYPTIKPSLLQKIKKFLKIK